MQAKNTVDITFDTYYDLLATILRKPTSRQSV